MTLNKIMSVAAISASLLGAGVATTAAISATATAQSSSAQTQSAKQIVDAAIARGEIGETAAGYLAPVDGSASSAVMAAMREINIIRKSLYTKTSNKTGESVDVVAALTGEKQLAKSAPGTKILTREGRWVTK